jgi:hypothetical protein
MGKTKNIEEQIDEIRCKLKECQKQHSALLHRASQGSGNIIPLYEAVWDPEQLLLSEEKLIRECIRIADYLLYCPE